ncbi:MAG: hypothetical protein ACAH88_05165 [Roseimicrobium sp.]
MSEIITDQHHPTAADAGFSAVSVFVLRGKSKKHGRNESASPGPHHQIFLRLVSAIPFPDVDGMMLALNLASGNLLWSFDTAFKASLARRKMPNDR